MKKIDVRYIFLMLAVAALIILAGPTWATDCRGSSCGDTTVTTDTTVNTGDVNVPVTMQGDTITGSTYKSEALAIANTLGDVDIAACLGSTQWGTPLFSKQKLVVNWVCLAEFYLRNQMWDNAAMAICNTEVRNEFDTEADCRAAHPFSVIFTQPVAVAESQDDDEEDGFHVEQEARYNAMAEELAALQQEINKPQPKPINKTVVEQRPLLTAEQRQALLELKQ